MRHCSVLLAVSLMAIGAAAASTGPPPEDGARAHVCSYCGEAITGDLIEAGGAFFHPGHFRCSHCDGALEGQYLSYEGKALHRKCYLENIALRCALDGRVIEGDYTRDFWGNAYHSRHDRESERCEYCSRFISKRLTGGGVRYADGRRVCGICRKTGIDEPDQARALMREVATHLRDVGLKVHTSGLQLQLVRLEQMENFGVHSRHVRGYTWYGEQTGQASTGSLGTTTKSELKVYLLGGMPRHEAIFALAHELTHVWQFTHGSRPLALDGSSRLARDEAFSEGSCNYAAYRVLQRYPGAESDYLIEQLESSVDRIYGEGFRRVKRFVDEQGTDLWLELLARKKPLPSGY